MVKDLLEQIEALKNKAEELTREKEAIESMIDDLEFKLMLDSIQVGDEVKITDKYECYSSYVDFVDYLRDVEVINAHDAYRYAYSETPDESHKFEVLAIAPHLDNKTNTLLFVRDYINLKCYIMRADACVKVVNND